MYRILFIIPTILGIIQPTTNLLQNISIAITIIVCFDQFSDWIDFLKDVYNVITEDYTWCKHVIKYHGLSHLFELQWQRLMIPQVSLN